MTELEGYACILRATHRSRVKEGNNGALDLRGRLANETSDLKFHCVLYKVSNIRDCCLLERGYIV